MADSTDPASGADASDDARDDADEPNDELPADVVDEAERLTRIARQTPDPNEADARRERRDALLTDHEFTSRIRDDDGDDVLVLHPDEWHDADAGVIRTDRIDDISRAVEIRLEGTGDPDDWDTVDERNRELVAEVRDAHGEVHGDNAAALADFVGNHYAKRIEDLTAAELREFRDEYFVRNAWPSNAQRDAIEDSITLVYETADEPVPDDRER
ncbi:DUF7108 family protein [Natronolimnohabitans innermongolicus]|uniref:RnhA operon protein n=1 Tax=Natronolimnohabitans innermongolicus JCM 12255 TaxID=1227499 RepID=L9WS69_9EURY|nr:hypothetical protein [Natronolimnohabitans innermongolicus]ELY51153.1 hypothetical protein C493_17616 [Natronolimnohabitans innermongolicus JCM 12255]